MYTTGTMFGDGGWFGGGLHVQVRRHGRWRDVEGLKISPSYPYDASAGPFRTFTLHFNATRGDGVRIIGRPGGTALFTSFAELEAYFAGHGRH